MYESESWTVKKAEHWKIDAFELRCWRRLLRVPWTARRSQSILKEISPEYSLEGLMMKLKLQYLGHLMGRANSLEKTLVLGKIEGRRRRGWQMRWLDGIIDSMTINLSKLLEIVKDRKPGMLQSMGSQRVGQDWGAEQEHLLWSPFKLINYPSFSPLAVEHLCMCSFSLILFWVPFKVSLLVFQNVCHLSLVLCCRLHYGLLQEHTSFLLCVWSKMKVFCPWAWHNGQIWKIMINSMVHFIKKHIELANENCKRIWIIWTIGMKSEGL